MSDTGKRKQRAFESKRQAELAREADIQRNRLYGVEANSISASSARDAAKAMEVLEGRDVSLYAVAKDWLARQEEAEASCTLNELYQAYRAEKINTVSGLYLRDIDKFFAPLVEKLGAEIVAHLRGTQIKEVMAEAFRTPRQFANAYRTIRPAFTFAMTEEFTKSNPFDTIRIPKVTKAPTTRLSVDQVKAVFNACDDFTHDETTLKSYKIDCSDCLAAFALMTFAGVRPEEIGKLQWEKVHFDDECIIIDGHVSKVRSHRIIPMSANLMDWLRLTSESERNGNVTPPNWKLKYTAVRHNSGIKSEDQDILRHTFASMHLAAYGDLNELQAAMGHGTPEMILKHYKAIVRKREAIQFWSIRPDSTAPQLEATA